MSHFLGRLVDRARGTAPRVEPLVAPRFAPAAIFEVASEVDALPADRQEQPRIASRASPAEKPDGERVSEADRLPLPRDNVNPDLESEKLPVPMAEHSMVLVQPALAANREEPLGKNGKTLAAASAAKRPRSAAPIPTTLLHFEHRPLRPNETSEERPIVRVTIGRIDVRATPTAAPSRKSPTRSEPKLTLEAYLKSRREGAR
jgi:hypothetical protein